MSHLVGGGASKVKKGADAVPVLPVAVIAHDAIGAGRTTRELGVSEQSLNPGHTPKSSCNPKQAMHPTPLGRELHGVVMLSSRRSSEPAKSHRSDFPGGLGWQDKIQFACPQPEAKRCPGSHSNVENRRSKSEAATRLGRR